jgi:hypothetical protein
VLPTDLIVQGLDWMSWWLLSWSRNPMFFMKPGYLLPCSRKPRIEPCSATWIHQTPSQHNPARSIFRCSLRSGVSLSSPWFPLLEHWSTVGREVVVGTRFCRTVTSDYSARITNGADDLGSCKCKNGQRRNPWRRTTFVQQWPTCCDVRNAFGISIYSKEYTFLIL